MNRRRLSRTIDRLAALEADCLASWRSNSADSLSRAIAESARKARERAELELDHQPPAVESLNLFGEEN